MYTHPRPQREFELLDALLEAVSVAETQAHVPDEALGGRFHRGERKELGQLRVVGEDRVSEAVLVHEHRATRDAPSDLRRVRLAGIELVEDPLAPFGVCCLGEVRAEPLDLEEPELEHQLLGGAVVAQQFERVLDVPEVLGRESAGGGHARSERRLCHPLAVAKCDCEIERHLGGQERV